MIGVKCEADRLIEVAEEIAAFPETDYVVVTAGTYDILVECVAEDNEALLAVPRRAPAQDQGRARDGDVRVPAADEAELPVGDPVGPPSQRHRAPRPTPSGKRCAVGGSALAPTTIAILRHGFALDASGCSFLAAIDTFGPIR